MDTCHKISSYMQKSGYACRVIGIPKTIDNDLVGTDHCPGYPSAAKYVATSLMELSQDARVYDTGVILVVEIMGRNAGWLTAAGALAAHKGCGPDLIYLPEVPFDLERFAARVDEIYRQNKMCIAVVSEGIRDASGAYIYRQNAADCFGHVQLGGLASYLADVLRARTNAKVWDIVLSLLQRCAGHCASGTDVEEACRAGRAAVECAVAGATGQMVGFVRAEGSSYASEIRLFPLGAVANREKKLPVSWINETHDGLLQPFIDYALPLIQARRARC